jgi:hypothetical protein
MVRDSQATLVARGAAKLIAADDGLRIGALALDGWDTHANEGGALGRLAPFLRPHARQIISSSRPSEARAGNHNHQCGLFERAGGSARNHREHLWLMVWTAPYGISVPE